MEPKFKVGDKVRAVAQTNGWGWVKEGDIGVITHTPETHPASRVLYRADFPNNKNWNGEECCFELVVEEPNEPKLAHYGKNATDKTDGLTHIINGPATIVILHEDGKTYKGIAKCAPGDTFNEYKGFDIAVHRAHIKRLQSELKKLCK